MRQRPLLSAVHPELWAHGICATCGHRADEHFDDLPSPCHKDRADLLCIDASDPAYGCKCIGFVPSRADMLRLARERTGMSVVHCRRLPHDLYIGRAMPGLNASIWGNPLYLRENATAADRLECVLRYRRHVLNTDYLLQRLKNAELVGKVLGCWCKKDGPDDPTICHGDELVLMQYEFIRGTKKVKR